MYPNLSALESDAKRMVLNAKHFNPKGTPLYEDAERVRKTASNFMTKHNPAYRDPQYVAMATPLPDDVFSDGYRMPPPLEVDYLREEPPLEPVPVQMDDAVLEPTLTGEAADEDPDARSLQRKTFQQAQEMIIDDLMTFTEYAPFRFGLANVDRDDLQIFTPFVNLPSRTLLDYYQVIKRPVSLKSIAKRVRGAHGRGAATGVTDFSTWAAFEEEVGYIWKNARAYNEDGSEMFNLAADFEEVFKEKMAEAKAVVEQPPAQTLKLKVAQSGIKIKLGAARESPNSTPGPASTPGDDRQTPGVIVHNEALERQQKLVSAGMNGVRTARHLANGSGVSSTAIPSLTTHKSSRSTSAASPPRQANGIKTEGQSPAPAPAHNVRLHSRAHMLVSAHALVLIAQSHSYAGQGSSLDGPPSGMIPSKYRPSGERKDAPNLASLTRSEPSDYILPSLLISSHPALGLPKPFSIRIPASSSAYHQSVTITLPDTHYILRFIPQLPEAVTTRPYRLFVTVNGNRASEVKAMAPAERDKNRPLFEGRLEIGAVNKIEVELLAGKPSAGGRGKEEVQWEKITCFVHVMRS
jgi:hypothetical protein